MKKKKLDSITLCKVRDCREDTMMDKEKENEKEKEKTSLVTLKFHHPAL